MPPTETPLMAHPGATEMTSAAPGGAGIRRSEAGAPRSAVDGVLPCELLIGGRWVAAAGGRRLAVEDPATERPVAWVADAAPSDCLAALEAAAGAQSEWGLAAPRERSRILRHAAEQLRRQTASVAQLITREMGKPLSESRAEVAFAADYLEWFADQAGRIDGYLTRSPDGSRRHIVTRAPIGPCLIITAWNFPLVIPARAVAAALAAGCTVVLRPSSSAPLASLVLARCLCAAGLPPGVLNVVVSSDDDATDPLLEDGRIRKLTFTGSAAIGRQLIARSAAQLVRTSMELGGCAPFLVFADADLDAAVAGAVAAKMRNSGASCTAANRFYVEHGIYDEFARRLAAQVARVRIGPGVREGVTCGPMIAAREVHRLTALVDDAVARGARTLLAGGPVPGAGHFFAPVVMCDVPPQARVMREEIFGPIVALAPFLHEEEAVCVADAHPAGLAAYLYTGDPVRATRLTDCIHAGMIAVNCARVSCVAAPFGGVGQSGFGVAGGVEGIDEYLVTRCTTMPSSRREH